MSVPHEWIEVGNRRWCRNCSAFRIKHGYPGYEWPAEQFPNCDQKYLRIRESKAAALTATAKGE